MLSARSCAKANIKNISDSELPVDVSFYIPTMMENPHTESITLPPKSDETYNLGVSFSSDVLTSAKASFDNLVQPDIKVAYKQDGEEKLAQKKNVFIGVFFVFSCFLLISSLG